MARPLIELAVQCLLLSSSKGKNYKQAYGAPMKSDVEKTIDARVAAAFADILPGKHELLNRAQELVRAVWIGKIYAALPKDRTTIPEYFLDAELEQFLNEAIEECHARICSIAERVKEQF
jgi:hypothetical protein